MLVLMMAVLQKLQYVQNMDTVSVLPINLEVQLVDQALMMLLEVRDKRVDRQMEQKVMLMECRSMKDRDMFRMKQPLMTIKYMKNMIKRKPMTMI